jgi:hypothetical protein
VRAAVVVAPLAVSLAVTQVAAAALWRRPGWLGLLAFGAQVVVVGLASSLLAGRAARRALPLAALLELALVFPDRAPRRFGVALRAGTLRQLRQELAALREGGPPLDGQAAAEKLVTLVTALSHHDRLTRGHTERVRAYAEVIGQSMGLPPADREKLNWAAMVHDVGKLMVPPELLNKDGPPTDEEWQVLQQHPAEGGRLVEPLAGWLGDWRLAASQHHERWGGGGYPLGLAGTDISLAGRIVAVADAYDVITSKRSYKALHEQPPQAMADEDQRAGSKTIKLQLVECIDCSVIQRHGGTLPGTRTHGIAKRPDPNSRQFLAKPFRPERVHITLWVPGIYRITVQPVNENHVSAPVWIVTAGYLQ